MSKERQITIKGDAYKSVIVSGENNIIIFQADVPAPSEQLKKTGSDANPYRGLEAFTEHDVERFFGRETLTKKLYYRFRDIYENVPDGAEQIRLLPIIGPSGSGKSSVARAGFIAELARNPLPGHRHVQAAVVTPGARPIERLATILARIATGDKSPTKKTKQFVTQLSEQTKDGRFDGLRFLAEFLPEIDRRPLILIVDQFEVLFDQCKDESEQNAFINNLLEAAADTSRRVSVVLVMRSDFLDATNPYPLLSNLIAEQGIIVPALKPSELEQAIAMPAANAGHPIDAPTIQRLIAQTTGRQGALPLLQLTLEQIWEGMIKGHAPSDVLNRLGGVGGTLAGIAQNLYGRLPESDRPVVRRAFMAMVQPGKGHLYTRRRAAISEIVGQDLTIDHVLSVLRTFSEPTRRLVTLSAEKDGEIFVEVVHETLFEHWVLLLQWIEQNRPMILLHHRLNQAAQHWDEKGRPAGLLWRPPALDDLRRFADQAAADMTTVESAFYHASQRAQQRLQHRQGWFSAAAITVAVLMAILAFFSFNLKKEAERQSTQARQQSELALARQLAAQATLTLTNEPEELVKGTLLAIESLKRAPTVEGYHGWEQAMKLLPRDVQRYRYNDDVNALAFSPDGRRLAATVTRGTVAASGMAHIWNVSNDKPGLQVDHDGWLTAIAFSPDSQLFGTASWDHTVSVADINTGKVRHRLQHSDAVWALSFSPDGKLLAVGCRDGKVIVYGLKDMQPRWSASHADTVNDLIFTPDSHFLATASKDKTVCIWDCETGKKIKQLVHDTEVNRIHLSPDGALLVSRCKDDPSPRVWDIEKGEEAFRLINDGLVHDLKFNQAGSRIITGGGDLMVKVWDAANGKVLKRFPYKGDISDITIHPDGQRIATIDHPESTATVWDLNRSTLLFRLPKKRLKDVIFSPNGQTIVTVGADNQFRLWNAATGEALAHYSHPDDVNQVLFSPDGQWLAAAVNFGNRGYSWGEAVVREIDSGRKPLRFGGHPRALSSIQFSADNRFVVTGSWDRTARIWDSFSGMEVQRLVHQGPVMKALISHDGKHLTTSSRPSHSESARGKYVQTWDLESGRMKRNMADPGGIKRFLLNIDHTRALTQGYDNTIRLWDASNGQELQSLPVKDSEELLGFHPEGQYFASYLNANKKMIALKNVTDGQLIAKLAHTDDIRSIAFSPDGKRLAALLAKKDEITIWDMKTKRTIAHIHQPKSDMGSSQILQFQFNQDGDLLASSGLNDPVRIWDTTTGEIISVLHDAADPAPALFFFDFHKDGQLIATSGNGSSRNPATGKLQSQPSIVRVWDPYTGKLKFKTSANAGHQPTYGPDGSMLATSTNEWIKVWNANNGNLLQQFTHERVALQKFPLFSPDSRFVIKSIGRKLYVWDLKTGKQRPPILLPAELWNMAFVTGTDILITFDWGQQVRGWRLATGKEVFQLNHKGTVNHVVISADGNHAVTVNAGMVQTWATRNSRKLAHFSLDFAITAHISQSGKLLATFHQSTLGTNIDIWKAATGEHVGSLIHQSSVHDCAFSNNDKLLAALTQDNRLYIWDTEKVSKLFELQSPLNFESRAEVVFSPDDTKMAAKAGDQLIVWDLNQKKLIAQISHYGSSIDQIVFSPTDGRLISSNGTPVVRLFNPDHARPEILRMAHKNSVMSVAISSDGRLLAPEVYESTESPVWDLTSGRPLFHVRHDKRIFALSFSPNSKWLVTAGADRRIRIWDVRNGKIKDELIFDDRFSEFAFSPDSKLLAIRTSIEEVDNKVAWNKGKLQVFNITTKLKKIHEIDSYINAFAFSPDVARMATGEGAEADLSNNANFLEWPHPQNHPTRGFLGTRVWELSTGKELLRLPNEQPVNKVVFNPNGTVLATMNNHKYNNTIFFWKTETGQQVGKLQASSDRDYIRSIVFSPDGKTVFARETNDITIWDTQTWQPKTILHHENGIDEMRVSIDGRHLAVEIQKEGNTDGKVSIWDWIKGLKLVEFSPGGDIYELMYTPDGNRIITAGGDNNIKIWQWRAEELVADACARLETSLTKAEWRAFLGEEPYRRTCPGLPVPDK